MENIKQELSKDIEFKKADLQLSDEWDKVFPQSPDVRHHKASFVNHFGITLAADQYESLNAQGKLKALAVCGPYSAVLIIHGEKAHSLYFGKDAYAKLKGDNKEMMIIPAASHTDLYDNMEIIPWDKMESFFNQCLK